MMNINSQAAAQVTDYLKKKGFTKTEAIFRQETAYLGPDGRPAQRSDDPGPKKYLKAFVLLKNWIENNLDIYKVSQTPTRGSHGC
jgi:transcription initiation factor TFIID subunit 5